MVSAWTATQRPSTPSKPPPHPQQIGEILDTVQVHSDEQRPALQAPPPARPHEHQTPPLPMQRAGAGLTRPRTTPCTQRLLLKETQLCLNELEGAGTLLKPLEGSGRHDPVCWPWIWGHYGLYLVYLSCRPTPSAWSAWPLALKGGISQVTQTTPTIFHRCKLVT